MGQAIGEKVSGASQTYMDESCDKNCRICMRILLTAQTGGKWQTVSFAIHTLRSQMNPLGYFKFPRRKYYILGLDQKGMRQNETQG